MSKNITIEEHLKLKKQAINSMSKAEYYDALQKALKIIENIKARIISIKK